MYLIPTGLTYTPWVYYLYAYFNLKAKCSWVFLSYDVTLGCYPQAPSSTQMTDLSFSPVPRHDRTGLWSLSSLDALTLKLTYQTHTHTHSTPSQHTVNLPAQLVRDSGMSYSEVTWGPELYGVLVCEKTVIIEGGHVQAEYDHGHTVPTIQALVLQYCKMFLRKARGCLRWMICSQQTQNPPSNPS